VDLAIEDINTTKKRLRVEIPADVIEKEIGLSLQKLKQKAKIPGFRQGMAPMNLLEKRFGKDVEAEVLDKIIPQYFGKALKEANIEPVTFPVIDEKIGFERNKPLNLSFIIEVLPKIEDIQYENITIKEVPLVVNESDVDEYLTSLQESRAVFEVADKAIDVDDLVSFEFIDCAVKGEETSSPSIKEQISQMGNEILPLDIMDKVLGKKKGELLEFDTTFDERCKSKELVGKTVDITLKISEIKKKNLPVIDDGFSKDLGFDNMSQMREKVKEKIHEIKKEHVRRLHKAKIMNQILEPHNFDVPETLLKKEIESLAMQESVSQKESPETVGQEERADKDPEAMQAEFEKKALRNVRASIILNAIGAKEGVTVSDNEVEERIALIAQRLSTTPERVRNFYTYREGSLDGLRHSIFEDKVMDLLLSKVQIEKGE
jgi:trigger factor